MLHIFDPAPMAYSRIIAILFLFGAILYPAYSNAANLSFDPYQPIRDASITPNPFNGINYLLCQKFRVTDSIITGFFFDFKRQTSDGAMTIGNAVYPQVYLRSGSCNGTFLAQSRYYQQPPFSQTFGTSQAGFDQLKSDMPYNQWRSIPLPLDVPYTATVGTDLYVVLTPQNGNFSNPWEVGRSATDTYALGVAYLGNGGGPTYTAQSYDFTFGVYGFQPSNPNIPRTYIDYPLDGATFSASGVSETGIDLSIHSTILSASTTETVRYRALLYKGNRLLMTHLFGANGFTTSGFASGTVNFDGDLFKTSGSYKFVASSYFASGNEFGEATSTEIVVFNEDAGGEGESATGTLIIMSVGKMPAFTCEPGLGNGFCIGYTIGNWLPKFAVWLLFPPSISSFVPDELFDLVKSRWPFNYIFQAVDSFNAGFATSPSCPLPDVMGQTLGPTFRNTTLPVFQICPLVLEWSNAIEAQTYLKNTLVMLVYLGGLMLSFKLALMIL